MPLTRYEIRNEYGLANRELYRTAQKNDPQGILQGVAMVGLVGIVRQLGDLAEFAAEIFHDLHEEVTATAARSHDLVARVIQLEAELPILEKSLLSEMNQLQFAYTPGIEWHASIRNDQNHCTQGDLPRFIRSSYEECRGPPRLFLLDKFDVAGAGACLKRYTDPSFFKMEWASGELMKAEKAQLEKKTRRGKKRGKRHRSEMKERMATRSAAQMPTRARFSSLSTSSLDGLSEGTTPKSLPGTTQMEASPKQPILENENQENIIKMNAGGEHFRKFEKLEESQKHLETLMDASRLSLALGTKPMKTNSDEPASMPKEFENFTHASRLSLGLETKPIKASSEEPARIPVEDLESGNGSLQAELERDCKPERETEEVVANVDDAASEGDNFVDALTYMESETDSESRERQRLVSSEIRPVVTSFGSDTDSEPEAVQSSNGQHPSEIRPTVASFDSDTDSELAHDSIPQHPLEIRPAVTSFNEDSDLDMQAAQGSTSQYPFPVSHPSSDSDSRMSDSGRSPGRSELKQHSNDDLFVKSMEISNANGIMEAKSAEEGLGAFASDPGHLAGAPRLDQGANGTSIRNAAIAQNDVSGSGSDTSEAGSTSEDTGDFDGQSGESDAEIGATHWELSSDDEDYIARQMLNNSNIHSLKQQSPVVEAENSTNVTDLPESDSDSITPIVLAIETMTVITQDASARSIDGTSQSGVKMLSQYHNDERMRDDGFDVSEMDLQLRTMEIFGTGLTPSAENNELDLQAIPKEVGGPQEDHMALSPESGYKHENEEPVGSLDTEKGIVSSIEGVDISKDNPYLQDGDPQDDATMEKMGSVSREVSGQSLSGKAGTEPSKPYTEFSLLENISKAFEAHKTVECTTSPESADQYATQSAESTSTNDNFMHSELSLQNETGVNARPIQSSMDKKEGTASNTLVFQKSGHVREDYMNEDCLKGSTGSFDLADTSTYEQSEQARSPPVGQTLFNPNESIQPEVDAIDVKKVDEHEMIPLRISTMPTSDTSSSSLSTPRYLESPVYDYRNGQLSPASSQLSPDLSPKSPVFSALLSPLSPGKASVPLPKFLENQGNQIAGMAQADYAAISSSPPLEAMPPLPLVSFRKASMPLPNFVETQSNQTAAMAQADVSISSSPPSLPPLPPLKWRNMQSPTMQSPTQVGSPTIPSPPNLPGKPLGVLQKFPLSRPLLKDERSDALVESISLHDRSKLKKVVTQPRSPRPRVLDDREVLLEQIRNKSFSLKRTVVQKQATPSRPIANINVAAILEKANAIRQAFVGSDEDDDDNWSDA